MAVTWRRPAARRTAREPRLFLKMTALAMLALFFATACLQLDMNFSVHDDGSGSIELVLHQEERLMSLQALQEGRDPDDICEDSVEDLMIALETPDTSELPGLFSSNMAFDGEWEAADGNCITTLIGAWTADDSEEVLGLWAEEGLVFRRSDSGGWQFESVGTEDGQESTPGDESELEALQQMAVIGLLPELTISVTLPGDPVRHNADSVSGSTYSWDFLERLFAATDDVPFSLYVETARSDGSAWALPAESAPVPVPTEPAEADVPVEATAEERAESALFPAPTEAAPRATSTNAITVGDSETRPTAPSDDDRVSAVAFDAASRPTTSTDGGLGPEAIGVIVAGVGLALAALVTLRRHQDAQAANSGATGVEGTSVADVESAADSTDTPAGDTESSIDETRGAQD